MEAAFDVAAAQQLTAVARERFAQLQQQQQLNRGGHNVPPPVFSPPDTLFALGGRGTGMDAMQSRAPLC